jgi:hypothetical protein
VIMISRVYDDWEFQFCFVFVSVSKAFSGQNGHWEWSLL